MTYATSDYILDHAKFNIHVNGVASDQDKLYVNEGVDAADVNGASNSFPQRNYEENDVKMVI